MDIKKIIQEQELYNFPIGLCNDKISDPNFESREYDLVVFDGKSESSKIVNYDNEYVIIHHASLTETQSKKLLLYDNLQIIQDESWELRMLLSKINEKRISLYNDFAKNCLIESMFCCQQTRESIEISNVFAPCWQKCASYFLADAICSLNHKKPNPFHMLYLLRNFDQNLINKNIPIATQTVGIERATPTLLDRMLKSTIGFSNLIEKNNHHEIIQKKHDFFIKNSMLSDCYFYLGYVNKKNFVKVKNTLNLEGGLIHILKIAFDVEADSHLLIQNVDLIQNSCKTMLEMFSRY
ncbi:hypothetical protein [Nitrosopumilus sp.]|uniref:hypothetical protein n=1 Tax=Nitrosopumilus sp. TaxID=2024843 RepID=UPI00292D45AB|nr:hypothetical protein [Nitrosopumilus sp.]